MDLVWLACCAPLTRADGIEHLPLESVQENGMEEKISMKSENILLFPSFPTSAFSAKYNAYARSAFKPLI